MQNSSPRRARTAPQKNTSTPLLARCLKANAVPLTLTAAALILSACGGDSSGGDSATPVLDATPGLLTPVQGGNTNNGALVQEGQFAGLDQTCVDTLLDIDPNADVGVIQLSCRPENIEAGNDGDEIPANEIPTNETPVTTPPLVSPPLTTAGLNVAPADVPGGSYYQNSRVSTLLSGPLFGSGTRPNSELVKAVSVQIEDVDPGLNFLELRAVRDAFGTSATDYVAVVQNTSTDFLCSVTLRGISEISAGGQPFVGDSLDFALLSGEIGVISTDTFYFPSCLQPGSLGYMTSFRDIDFDDLAEIRAESLSSRNNRVQVPGSVLPTGYSLNTDGSVSITIVNNHSEPLDVFSVDALAIDDQGHAFSFDFELPRTTMAPGEELVVDNFFRRFQGRASTIRAIVDFRLP